MKQNGQDSVGVVLEVDLSNGSVQKKPISRELMEQYIGGQGIGSYLLYKEVGPSVQPLGPDNVLLLCAGVLVGTMVPSASRTTFMSKSPTPGGYLGMSNGGGMQYLKLAGYDILMVKGRASEPVYLKITNDRVEICSARHLWGKDTFDTADILWSEIGSPYQIAAIGPAGENLVRYACIIGDKHVAWGRTGLGAVMGSKMLKAIAVYGDVGVQVVNQPRLMRVAKQCTREILGNTEAIQVWREGGTWAWGANRRHLGALPKAASEVFDHSNWEAKLDHRPLACMGCPVGCKAALRVKDGVKHAGLSFNLGCTSGAMCRPFGSALGIVPLEEVAKCAEEVQRLGMDSYGASGLISMAIELWEAGIITGSDTGGLELTWSDPELVHKLMRMIAHREGFGDPLAEGAIKFAEAIGRGAEKYLHHYKGMAKASAHHGGSDIRKQINTLSLGWIVNYRGHGDRHRYPHLGNTADQKAGNLETIRQLAGHMGVPAEEMAKQSHDPAEFAPWAMRYVEDYNTVAYCLGLCDRPVILNAMSIDTQADIYTAATGIEVSAQDLLRGGRRVWTLEKAWVTLQGQTRKQDYPPERFFSETSKTLGGVSDPLNREVFDGILDRYYQGQGWDRETGIPTSETLRFLGLDEMDQDLKRHLSTTPAAVP